jgi:hypothetical protein
MKRHIGFSIVAGGALLATMMMAKGASAQDVVPVPVSPVQGPTAPSSYPRAPERAELAKPNPVLFGSGGLAFAGAYIPGIVVAASSDHDGDKWLYAPLIGPWIDLGTRGCENSIATPTCGVTGFDRAALITSGVVQALGAAAMLGSFAVPQRHLVIGGNNVQIAPASFDSRGHGVMAFGNF